MTNPIVRRRLERSVGPFEGVPASLKPSLVAWIGDAANFIARHTGMPVEDVVRTIELQLGDRSFTMEKIPTTDPLLRLENFNRTDLDVLIDTARGDSELALDIVALLVVLLVDQADAASAVWLKELERILTIGHSVWEVDAEGGQLVSRVDPTVGDRADAVTAEESNAARYLADAWRELRRRGGDFDLALDHANKALEAAAKPVVLPNSAKATLGTIIAALRDKPAKCTCALGAIDEIAARLETIWKAQRRHGVDDSAELVRVNPSAAEAAVHEATTLVVWFRNGLIRIAPTHPV